MRNRRSAALVAGLALTAMRTVLGSTVAVTFSQFSSTQSVNASNGSFADWVMPTNTSSTSSPMGERMTLSGLITVTPTIGTFRTFLGGGSVALTSNQGYPTASGTFQDDLTLSSVTLNGNYSSAYQVSTPVLSGTSGTLTIYTSFATAGSNYSVSIPGGGNPASGPVPANPQQIDGDFSVAFNATTSGNLVFTFYCAVPTSVGHGYDINFDGATLSEPVSRIIPISLGSNSGVYSPENIVQSGSSYYVISNDLSPYNVVGLLSPTGGTMTTAYNLSSLAVGFNGGCVPPTTFGSNYLAFGSPTAGGSGVVYGGSSGTTLQATLAPAMGTGTLVFGQTMPVTSFGAFGGEVLATTGEPGSARLVALSSNKTFTTVATLPFAAGSSGNPEAFGIAQAPSGFGSFGGDVLVSDYYTGTIDAVTPTGTVLPFARVPLVGNQTGFRQIAFSPSGFFTGQGIDLLISVASSSGGQILVINSAGTIVESLDPTAEPAYFNPRGLTFSTDSRLLVADYNNSQIDSTTAAAFVTGYPINVAANGSSGFVFPVSAGARGLAVGPITVNPGASLNISTTPTAAGRGVVITPSVTFVAAAGGSPVPGKVDLGVNDLDITSMTLAAADALVAEGYNLPGGTGLWTGQGITSSAAASDTSGLTGLGVIQNNQGGSPLYTAANPFDSVTPGAGDVLIKYTYYGDANLDGEVDGSDYTLIDAGYASGGALTGWFNGDFNYDGVIDGSDYALIDNAFNNQGTSLNSTAQVAVDTELVAGPAAAVPTAAVPAAAVPEPAMASLMLSPFALLFYGRQRKRLGTVGGTKIERS